MQTEQGGKLLTFDQDEVASMLLEKMRQDGKLPTAAKWVGSEICFWSNKKTHEWRVTVEMKTAGDVMSDGFISMLHDWIFQDTGEELRSQHTYRL